MAPAAGTVRIRCAGSGLIQAPSVDALVDDVFAALIQQSVTVIGTGAVESVFPCVAQQITRG